MNLPTRDEFSEEVRRAGIKPRLRRALRYVPEEVTYPELRDFLVVSDRADQQGVLCYDGKMIPYERSSRIAKNNGQITAVICDICATWRRGPESATITFPKGDKSTVSHLVCADLDCSLHVRGLTDASVLSRSQIREDITLEGRIKRLTMRASPRFSRISTHNVASADYL